MILTARQLAANKPPMHTKVRHIGALFFAMIIALAPMGAGTAHAAGSSGGGGGISAPTPSRSPASPEEIAQSAYKKGLKHKARAWKAEEKAETASSDKKRDRYAKRAQKEYLKAQSQYAKTLQILPEHYEAANEMGYALRKTGNYEKAIGAYNVALQTNPNFLQAIEYRGEALVQLGYYDQTREDYMRLFREDRELADQLMAAIDKWALTQTNPDAQVKAFLEWRESRREVGVLGDQIGSSGGSW